MSFFVGSIIFLAFAMFWGLTPRAQVTFFGWRMQNPILKGFFGAVIMVMAGIAFIVIGLLLASPLILLVFSPLK